MVITVRENIFDPTGTLTEAISGRWNRRKDLKLPAVSTDGLSESNKGE